MNSTPQMRPDAAFVHPTQQNNVVLRIAGLKKTFRSGNISLELFQDISLSVCQGEMAALVGESGSGKSTLLYMASALDTPTAGEVICAGQQLSGLTEDAASDFRNRTIGFVWQFHHLLPEFTALENIAMPLRARGMPREQAEGEAAVWLQEVGLAARATHRSGELSGGEQQRVALARALVTRPQLLLADEPTGNLDARNAAAVLELIARLHRDFALTSLIATHNLDFARQCHRVLRLRNGRVEEVEPHTLS